MRAILFRAKRIDNGKWIEGYPVKLGRESFSDPERYGICNKAIPLGGSGVCYNLKIDEVIPETVGQYTGFTDKNGKKVFEGDIVKWDYPCNSEHFYQVKYDGGCACFTTSRIHNSDVIDCIFDNDGNHCEVIGNIHDNPEMMKERDRRSNESN